jgi:hypothetical protein
MPHGSNITPLLKSRPPFLCQECHNGPHASINFVGQSVTSAGLASFKKPDGTQAIANSPNTNPAVPLTNNQSSGRACLNCHVQIHGSNSPAGPFLHR